MLTRRVLFNARPSASHSSKSVLQTASVGTVLDPECIPGPDHSFPLALGHFALV
jgi:hypothetical protein